VLEIIAVTPDEARVAEAAGAGRVELVSALSEGGLTPGFGLMKRTVAAVRIPVNVMIRPHSRGFHYGPEEIEVMKEEIRAARSVGAHGVVFGVLDERRTVDVVRLEALLACAEGLDVTFHRAVDAAADPVAAARTLSRYPVVRTLLSSGGPGRIEENVPTLIRMREAAGHVRVMAGGGWTHENAPRIARATGLRDFHVGTAVRSGQTVDGAIDPGRLAELARRLGDCGVELTS
jgi:copper homeostasis protein